jgi:hypothetical protein
MKSLNRTLSLVLVLVMVLGMFGIASAAEFTDKKDVQYKEAVEVMAGIGAINGMGDGTFVPKGTINRAQAAKMVAYTILGADVAKVLPVRASSFKDVDASAYAWAIPSIEYLVQKGVINGMGDGTFVPNGNVTGYQLAKMLLVALNVKGEFTGPSWELNTAIAASKIKLFEDSKATNYSAAATREEAALYCFNAILYSPDSTGTKTVTKYLCSAAGSGTKVPAACVGATYNSIAEATADVATKDNGVNNPVLGIDYTLTPVTETVAVKTGSIANNVYPSLNAVENGVDAFGRPAAIWKYGAKQKVIASAAATPVATYTTSVSQAELYTKLGGAYSIPTVINGATVTSGTITSAKGVSTLNGGNGIVTEIYQLSTNPVAYKAVQIVPTFNTVTVSSFKATATAGAYTNYTIGGVSGKVFSTVVDPLTDVNTAVVNGTVANGDKVLYYVDGEGTLHIDAVTTFDGVLSSVSSQGIYTINNAAYKLAAAGTSVAPATASQTFYKDSYGFILGTKTALSATNYGLVLDAKVIYTLAPDNTMKATNIYVVAKSDGTVANLPSATLDTGLKGELVTFSVDTSVTSATVYTVAAVAATDVDTVSKVSAITSKTNLLTTDGMGGGTAVCKYADAGTLFVIANYADGQPTGTVKTYTGIANVPSYTGLSKAYAVDTKLSGYDTVANVVFIYDNVNAVTSAQLVYVTGTYTTTTTAKVYDTIVNGQPSTISIGLTQSLSQGLYSSITVTAGVPSATPATAVTSATGIKLSQGLLYTTTNGTSFTVSDVPNAPDSTPVFVIHTVSGTCDTLTAATAGTLVGASAVYVVPNQTVATSTNAIYVLYNN